MAAIPSAYEPASLGKAWDLTIKHFSTFLLVSVASLVVGAISFMIVFGLGFVFSLAFQSIFSQGSSDGQSMAFSLGQLIASVVSLPFWVFGQLLTVLLSAVPAVYFTTGSKVTPGEAFRLILRRPWRYVFAGVVFSIAVVVGFICCLVPGFAIAFMGPVFMNKVFTSDQGVLDAFSSSFSDVYKNDQWLAFVGIQIVVALVASLPVLCCVFPVSLANAIIPIIVLPVYIVTILAYSSFVVPAASFYVQNVAYRRGFLS
jgi:hypothetical protein